MKALIRSIPAAASILLAATGLVTAQTPAPVSVRCRIALPSGITEPLTMLAQIYRVERDNLGFYQLKGQVQALTLPLEPGARGTTSGDFVANLSPGDDVEYEFKVVPIDNDGNERTDGRYYFVNSDPQGDYLSKDIPLRPGELNEVILNLRWIPNSREVKSNFLSVTPHAGGSDLTLSLYTNESTNVALNN